MRVIDVHDHMARGGAASVVLLLTLLALPVGAPAMQLQHFVREPAGARAEVHAIMPARTPSTEHVAILPAPTPYAEHAAVLPAPELVAEHLAVVPALLVTGRSN